MYNMKLAIIGGGSQFVPSIVNGLAQAMQEGPAFSAQIALFDVRLAAAERMARYGALVAQAHGLPLSVLACPTRAEALSGADLVLATVWLAEEHERYGALCARLGVDRAEDGPAGLAEALSLAPFFVQLGQEMARLCPEAWLVDVVNPTDILPAIVEGATGVRSLGLCVEVEGLRGLLAYHLGVPADALELDHVGINHDGWVLRLRLDGADAYPLWARVAQGLAQDPAFHPHAVGGWQVYHLTGYLRTSLYHNLPYGFEHSAEARERARQHWPDKRALYAQALEEALSDGAPIRDEEPLHPERSRLNYPGTGRQIGRMARAMATGVPSVSALQVRNNGAVANWPDDVTVEVPVAVAGRSVRPLAMGEAPEWLCGACRLGAIQRRLVADYALQRDPALLRQALAVIPWAMPLQTLAAYARELHQALSTWWPSAL